MDKIKCSHLRYLVSLKKKKGADPIGPLSQKKNSNRNTYITLIIIYLQQLQRDVNTKKK